MLAVKLVSQRGTWMLGNLVDLVVSPVDSDNNPATVMRMGDGNKFQGFWSGCSTCRKILAGLESLWIWMNLRWLEFRLRHASTKNDWLGQSAFGFAKSCHRSTQWPLVSPQVQLRGPLFRPFTCSGAALFASRSLNSVGSRAWRNSSPMWVFNGFHPLKVHVSAGGLHAGTDAPNLSVLIWETSWGSNELCVYFYPTSFTRSGFLGFFWFSCFERS